MHYHITNYLLLRYVVTAKVSVESFTGFAYDNETGLYKEKGQFVSHDSFFLHLKYGVPSQTHY